MHMHTFTASSGTACTQRVIRLVLTPCLLQTVYTTTDYVFSIPRLCIEPRRSAKADEIQTPPDLESPLECWPRPQFYR
ncbi:hypothetical protein V8F06_002462 [Rhypophila decipiens]